MKTTTLIAALSALSLSVALVAAAEKPVEFIPAKPDPWIGDWQGKEGSYVAQVYVAEGGAYRANLLTQFDAEDNVVAVLQGALSGGAITFSGDGWTGTLGGGHFKGSKEGKSFDLQHVTRGSPTLGAKPPKGAIVLFDGPSLDAWAKKKGKEWLVEDGPAPWKLVEGAAMEIVPNSDSIVSKRSFGDCKVHVEFRTLGKPTNSGVYLQARYEVNINETYGNVQGKPGGGLDNCTPAATMTRVHASRPALEWQTFDIEFRAPRFDTGGKKTENARATVLLNGVRLYDDRELDPPHLAAGRLGEAPTGPLMLQDHGQPVQFRNVWVVQQGTASPGAESKFHHPGVLIHRAQLDFIKIKVAAGSEPWRSAFEKAKASDLGSVSYTPSPRDVVVCGPRSNPNLGCKDEQRDSEAAYTQALLWYISGQEVYAENAIKIMNAWSSTLTGGHEGANGPVQAAWTAAVWPRAAEIIRHAYGKWKVSDIDKFQNMLAEQYVPSLIGGSCENGNKELSMAEALMHIGVFNDDRATFERGVTMWRGRTPAYIYLSTDGPRPVKPPNCDMAIWGNKGHTTPLVDGLLQETCRDSQHANLALSAMVNAAETARLQGVDLYAEEGKRIMAALEYQAQFLEPNNAPVPPYLEFNKHPTWEIAYNHYHNRLGHSLPKMARVLLTNRPTGVNHHMVWETLTHAEVGAVELPPLAAR